MTIDHDITTPAASIPAQPEAPESAQPAPAAAQSRQRHVHGSRCYWDHRDCRWHCAS